MNEIKVGGVNVLTTNGRGHSAEEMAQLALDRIIYVGRNSHPAIIDQAMAFRENIRNVLLEYFEKAQEQERLTIEAKLARHGHEHINALIRS